MRRLLLYWAVVVMSGGSAGHVGATSGAAAVGVIDDRVAISFPPGKCINDGEVYEAGGRIRYRFRLIGAGTGDAWRITVASRFGELEVTPHNRALLGEEFLSPLLDSERATICVTSDAPYLEVVAVIRGATGSRVLSVVGPKGEGPNFDPIADFENNLKHIELDGENHTKRFLTIVKGVAWLGIEHGREYLGCTGWFATPTLIVTNSHCALPGDQGATVRVWVRRALGESFGTRTRFDAPTYQSAEIVHSGAERNLDFALLRVPVAVPDSHVLRIEFGFQPGQTALIMPQFPHSGPMVVNLDADCITAGPSKRLPRMVHGCDSDQGSSGSPIIDRKMEHGVIGLHYWGHDGDQSKGNRAIPMHSVFGDLQVNAPALLAEIETSQRKLEK